MEDRKDAVQEGLCRTGGIQDRRDAGKRDEVTVRCSKGGMQ